MIHYGFVAERCPAIGPGRAALSVTTEDDQAVTCPDCRRLAGLALRTLTDGTQVYPGHVETVEAGPRQGQQRDYVVLSESERARGFVRPVRASYRHTKCGAVTTMGDSLAETYARDPGFYGATFCATCRAHFPVGEAGEFVWIESSGRDGPPVGT